MDNGQPACISLSCYTILSKMQTPIHVLEEELLAKFISSHENLWTVYNAYKNVYKVFSEEASSSSRSQGSPLVDSLVNNV